MGSPGHNAEKRPASKALDQQNQTGTPSKRAYLGPGDHTRRSAENQDDTSAQTPRTSFTDRLRAAQTTTFGDSTNLSGADGTISLAQLDMGNQTSTSGSGLASSSEVQVSKTTDLGAIATSSMLKHLGQTQRTTLETSIPRTTEETLPEIFGMQSDGFQLDNELTGFDFDENAFATMFGDNALNMDFHTSTFTDIPGPVAPEQPHARQDLNALHFEPTSSTEFALHGLDTGGFDEFLNAGTNPDFVDLTQLTTIGEPHLENQPAPTRKQPDRSLHLSENFLWDQDINPATLDATFTGSSSDLSARQTTDIYFDLNAPLDDHTNPLASMLEPDAFTNNAFLDGFGSADGAMALHNPEMQALQDSIFGNFSMDLTQFFQPTDNPGPSQTVEQVGVPGSDRTPAQSGQSAQTPLEKKHTQAFEDLKRDQGHEMFQLRYDQSIDSIVKTGQPDLAKQQKDAIRKLSLSHSAAREKLEYEQLEERKQLERPEHISEEDYSKINKIKMNQIKERYALERKKIDLDLRASANQDSHSPEAREHNERVRVFSQTSYDLWSKKQAVLHAVENQYISELLNKNSTQSKEEIEQNFTEDYERFQKQYDQYEKDFRQSQLKKNQESDHLANPEDSKQTERHSVQNKGMELVESVISASTEIKRKIVDIYKTLSESDQTKYRDLTNQHLTTASNQTDKHKEQIKSLYKRHLEFINLNSISEIEQTREARTQDYDNLRKAQEEERQTLLNEYTEKIKQQQELYDFAQLIQNTAASQREDI